jgi:hypothetical protein
VLQVECPQAVEWVGLLEWADLLEWVDLLGEIWEWADLLVDNLQEVDNQRH